MHQHLRVLRALLGLTLVALDVTFLTGASQTPSIVIAPGSDIQSAVDSHPPGTRFVIKAGRHRRQTIRPKDGDQFVGERGSVLDGELSAPYAFETLAVHPAGVRIEGLTITRYVPPRLHGAIQGDNGTNWTIANTEIFGNANDGLRPGPGARVIGNRIHHNGVTGIDGYRAHGVLIEGNEISANNTDQAPEEPSKATAAGIKLYESRDATIRHNNVHDNHAKGIWIDHGWPTTTIEDNIVRGNAAAGIWHEVSYAAIIRRNTVVGNGGTQPTTWLERAGINVTNSPDVQIYGNTVAENANGIAVMQATGYPNGPYGPNVVKNLDVHDNSVTMAVGRTGLAENENDPSVFTSRNNRFSRNSYTLGASPTYFTWKGRDLDERGWQGYGLDVDGHFDRSGGQRRAPKPGELGEQLDERRAFERRRR